MKMYINGQWVDRAETMPVVDPFKQTVIDTVPRASGADVQLAITSAVRGAQAMGKLTSYQRYEILRKAADLMSERAEDLAQTITQEEGKVISEGRVEAQRGVQTITISAEEAKRLHGETIPLDAAPGNVNQFGFTIRVPVGVVAAIAPFNFPLNLVCHKVGPALAAGNSVVLKPAGDTPLSALKLTEILLEAGLPEEAIQCVTGSGAEIGDVLTGDPRIRKITFTGSVEIGDRICRNAGVKKVTMELGSNSPLIIMSDADLEKVAAATAASGFSNAGQVCISTQRVFADRRIYADFLDALVESTKAYAPGNPQDESVRMGPMIRESDATRVGEWIAEAVQQGARIAIGGDYEGTLHAPTVIADATPDMRVSREELFGPALAVSSFSDIDEAIAMANDSRFGLSAGIFTQNIDWAMKFAKEVHSGNLHINSSPQWRADLMPYGGLKESGMGKEGPAYAVQEMTELKMVVFHL
ncbi:MAG: aldehyde dehydrogenase family protein [Chloroflexi bacterium]|nr:aldehyde dehydrogenase family protein [Chloroflexota bacterium]MCH8225551.1 aldehyde dehydrogenase family protein [Chloroflexota bacterium]MCI0846522.1 aldehyde dehydrogenase family protein [Chloroflexota bacterium]